MGTRSITYIYDENNDPLIALYRQYDGYPSVTGSEIVDFLKQFKMVNGLALENKQKIANGMGCLAAQFVAHFKTEPGRFYLQPPCKELDAWQEFEYFVTLKGDELNLKITDTNVTLYDGTVNECDPIKLEEEYYAEERD